ncbi:phosphoadenylyl-sulfate reductase [Rhodocytophaga rosea]|nr:phosphoadenylyl-sulfate reductase [Rhodocytophaga rosea]
MVQTETEGNLLFPVFLKLNELRVLIVGGGMIGLEKLSAILKNNPSTQITLVGISISDDIRALVSEYENIILEERPYQEEDLEDKDIVIAATTDRSLHEIIKRQAKAHKVLANIADTPDLCDFYLGSIVKKGDLKIAISTNGKSPTLAKRMRQYFEEALPESTQEVLNNMQAIRNGIKGDFAEKVNQLNELTASFVPQAIKITPSAEKKAERKPYDIEELNERYEKLTIDERILELYKDFGPEDVLLTSSFAGNSALLLHLFARLTGSKQKVHFIDTGYHFPETLAYKEKLTQMYNLNVIDLKAEVWKHRFTSEYNMWTKDPDLCCKVNKTEPLDAISGNYQVWVSGLIHTQNEHRKGLRLFEEKNGILKFYPILDITPEERDMYILTHDLHFHPLVFEGYGSIGCTHCTVKGTGREGRWFGQAKTECGLHI